jgi:hypothetical protein
MPELTPEKCWERHPEALTDHVAALRLLSDALVAWQKDRGKMASLERISRMNGQYGTPSSYVFAEVLEVLRRGPRSSANSVAREAGVNRQNCLHAIRILVEEGRIRQSEDGCLYLSQPDTPEGTDARL